MKCRVVLYYRNLLFSSHTFGMKRYLNVKALVCLYYKLGECVGMLFQSVAIQKTEITHYLVMKSNISSPNCQTI